MITLCNQKSWNAGIHRYSRVPNKGTGLLLENEKNSAYTIINFQKNVPPKDFFETKLKMCAYFRLISHHFFANDMIIFHKTEVQKIVLRCLTGLNSDWFNSYDTKCKYFHFSFFAILYKNTHLHFLCFCALSHNFCTN